MHSGGLTLPSKNKNVLVPPCSILLVCHHVKQLVIQEFFPERSAGFSPDPLDTVWGVFPRPLRYSMGGFALPHMGEGQEQSVNGWTHEGRHGHYGGT